MSILPSRTWCHSARPHRRQHVVKGRDIVTVHQGLARLDPFDDLGQVPDGLHEVVGVVEGIDRPLERQVVPQHPTGARNVALAERFEVLGDHARRG